MMRNFTRNQKQIMFKYFISVKALMIGIIFVLTSMSAGATDYYVAPADGPDPKGNDSNLGTSPSEPWTITKGFNTAQAGDVVYIRGGNYGHVHVTVANNGTPSEPIIFQGYDGTPELNGGSDGYGIGVYINGKKNILLKNIRVARYRYGVSAESSRFIDVYNVIADSCTSTHPDSLWFGYGIRFYETKRSRMKNCTATNNGGINLSMVYSDSCSIDSCQAYCTLSASDSYATDYYMHLGWSSYDTISNCHVEFTTGGDKGIHGIGIKDTQSMTGTHSHDNKFFDNTAYNFEECFYVAHGAHNNIFERCYGNNTNKQGRFNQVLMVRDGAHDNQFINCVAIGRVTAVTVYDGVEGVTTDQFQDNNSFTNCILKGGTNGTIGVFMRNARYTTFKNCTIDSCGYFLRFSYSRDAVTDRNDSLFFKNCIVSDVANSYDTVTRSGSFAYYYKDSGTAKETGYSDMADVSAIYTDFYNGFEALTGTGNFDSDPLYASESDYHLKSQYGRWNGSTWVTDTVTSACINAGDPHDFYDNEPIETGGPGRIDIGGYGNTSEASKRYSYSDNIAPVAIIDSINPDPAKFGSAVSFSGTGTDADGTIVAYEWYSSIDGVFCTAEDTTFTGLSTGTHTIYFSVKDNTGALSAFDTTTLVVVNNFLPVASIDNISPNPSTFGSAITFSGTATDNDGTITGYEWKSSIDGVFCTSEDTIHSELSVGGHTISFRVKDNWGDWSAYATAALDIYSVPENLVANWHLDENTDTIAYDASGNANTGILKNSPSWVTGKIGSALNFTDNYVEVPASVSINTITKNITLTGWVRPSPNTASSTIIDRWMYGTAGNSRGYCLYIASSGKISFGICKDGTSTYAKWLTSTSAITRDVWTYITATFDGKTMKIYINGALDASYVPGFSTIFVSTRDVYIGKWHDKPDSWVNPYKGDIDELRIYNVALSLSEIEEIYSITTSVEKISDEFKVTCYPNPFTSEITINYAVPVNGKVKMEIYNFSGQLIDKVVDEVQTAGQYSKVWNAESTKAGKLANGMYICKVYINGRITISRIMLMK